MNKKSSGKLDRKVTINLTDEQYKRLLKDAEGCNMNISDYIRKCLENNTITYYSLSPEIMRQICLISNIINEYKCTYPKIDLSDLEKGCGKLCALLN